MNLTKKHPKVKLGHGVTPLESLPNMSKLFPFYQLFIKRDDCTGLGMGGNKTRKLEYLMAEALSHNADVVITCGGVQSNHARQTAAAAAKLGLECHLILEPVAGTPKAYYQESGNVLLDHLFGAHIINISADEDSQAKMEHLAESLISQGRKPYIVPMGGSNIVGSLGYVACGLELAEQFKSQSLSIDTIVLATGSAGTQAGLLVGLALADLNINVIGICVSRSGNEQEELVFNLVQQILGYIDKPELISRDQVVANGSYYGEGYGILNTQTVDAINVMASKEGILLDPVYTGKAMSGLIDLATKNLLSGEKILFLHTGGSPGLFAYQTQL